MASDRLAAVAVIELQDANGKSSALCKAFHKADYAKYPIMESSVRS